MNIMSGYGVHIRALTDEDVRLYLGDLDLTARNLDRCIAVEGEDLGPSLCAVVELTPDCPDPLVWSSVPVPNGENPTWREITDSTFADSLANVVVTIIPEIDPRK